MYGFWDDFVAPVFAATITILLIFATIVATIVAKDSKIKSNECKFWGGEYHFSTGCLMEYSNKIIPLDEYKTIQKMEITQPIEHNINILNKGE